MKSCSLLCVGRRSKVVRPLGVPVEIGKDGASIAWKLRICLILVLLATPGVLLPTVVSNACNFAHTPKSSGAGHRFIPRKCSRSQRSVPSADSLYHRLKSTHHGSTMLLRAAQADRSGLVITDWSNVDFNSHTLILVEAWVVGSRRIGSQIAFVDLMNHDGSAVLQAVISSDSFSGACTEPLGDTRHHQSRPNAIGAQMEVCCNITNRRVYSAYTAMCKPGACLQLAGFTELGEFGEEMLQVRCARLIASAPCCHAAARLLVEVHEKILSVQEAALALGMHQAEQSLLELCAQCNATLQGTFAEFKHNYPDVACVLEECTSVLRKQLPSAVNKRAFRGYSALPDASRIPACHEAVRKQAAAAASAAEGQPLIFIDKQSTKASSAGMSIKCLLQALMSPITVVTGLIAVVGWVLARRRFDQELAVLVVGDEFIPVGNRMQSSTEAQKDRLHIVLDPNIVQPSCSLKMMTHLCAPGSCIRVVGVTLAGQHATSSRTLYATRISLQRCSHRLKELTYAIDCAVNGLLSPAEAALALDMPQSGEQSVEHLAGLDAVARRWAAADTARRFQSASTRQGKMAPGIQQILQIFAEVRDRWPVGTDDHVPEHTANSVTHTEGKMERSRSSKVKLEFRYASRWGHAKGPQIEWMMKTVRVLASQHPDAATRPLHIIDVGGGQGLLASRLAEKLGPTQVKVTVLEIASMAISRGRRRAERRHLSNLTFIRADASGTRLQGLQKPDIVVALHACGTLSDVALSLAAKHHAAFCVCQCCFKSHPHLQINGMSAAAWLSVPAENLQALRGAASVVGDPNMAKIGMHTVSALRGDAVLRHWGESGRESSQNTLVARVAQFPAAYSPCNLCLIGALVDNSASMANAIT